VVSGGFGGEAGKGEEDAGLWGWGLALTHVRPSARDCVAEASSMAKSRKEREVEKAAGGGAVR